MLPDERHQHIKARFATIQIIAAAMLGSVFIYGAIAALGFVPPQANPGNQMIVPVLVGMGAMQLVFAPVIRKVLFRPKLSEDPEKNVSAVLTSYFTSRVVGLALWESVAIFGLVIYFLSGNTTWCLTLCAATVLAMVLGWPKLSEVEDALANQSRSFRPESGSI